MSNSFLNKKFLIINNKIPYSFLTHTHIYIYIYHSATNHNKINTHLLTYHYFFIGCPPWGVAQVQGLAGLTPGQATLSLLLPS
jgi:hypothetical protein